MRSTCIKQSCIPKNHKWWRWLLWCREKSMSPAMASPAWMIVILHLKLLRLLFSPSKVFEGSWARTEATPAKIYIGCTRRINEIEMAEAIDRMMKAASWKIWQEAVQIRSVIISPYVQCPIVELKIKFIFAYLPACGDSSQSCFHSDLVSKIFMITFYC